MTRQDFLDFAIKNNPLNEHELKYGFKPYKREELAAGIIKIYPQEFNAEQILDFFENVGYVYFDRAESVSGDILTIALGWARYIEHWDDIGKIVCAIGDIGNCADQNIDRFFLSEDGRFYTHKHMLIADNEESFFDHLMTVEFDYHPIIEERVYEVLRGAGWYDGRRVDVSAFNEEMKRRGFLLSQAQLDFLSEFSGIGFYCKSEHHYIYSLEEILDNCEVLPDENGNPCIMDIGDSMGMPGALEYNGLIGLDRPWGRTPMECINSIVKNVYGW